VSAIEGKDLVDVVAFPALDGVDPSEDEEEEDEEDEEGLLVEEWAARSRYFAIREDSLASKEGADGSPLVEGKRLGLSWAKLRDGTLDCLTGEVFVDGWGTEEGRSTTKRRISEGREVLS
jgi:hypothetical protein